MEFSSSLIELVLVGGTFSSAEDVKTVTFRLFLGRGVDVSRVFKTFIETPGVDLETTGVDLETTGDVSDIWGRVFETEGSVFLEVDVSDIWDRVFETEGSAFLEPKVDVSGIWEGVVLSQKLSSSSSKSVSSLLQKKLINLQYI